MLVVLVVVVVVVVVVIVNIRNLDQCVHFYFIVAIFRSVHFAKLSAFSSLYPSKCFQ